MKRTAMQLCGLESGAKVEKILREHLERRAPQLMPTLLKAAQRPPELNSDTIAELLWGDSFDFGGKLDFVNRLIGLLAIPFEKVVWPAVPLTQEEDVFWRDTVTRKKLGFVIASNGVLPEDFLIKVVIARAALAELCTRTNPSAAPTA